VGVNFGCRLQQHHVMLFINVHLLMPDFTHCYGIITDMCKYVYTLSVVFAYNEDVSAYYQ